MLAQACITEEQKSLWGWSNPLRHRQTAVRGQRGLQECEETEPPRKNVLSGDLSSTITRMHLRTQDIEFNSGTLRFCSMEIGNAHFGHELSNPSRLGDHALVGNTLGSGRRRWIGLGNPSLDLYMPHLRQVACPCELSRSAAVRTNSGLEMV